MKHETPSIRRAQIMNAARHCIAEQGFERATMDDIARAANLSKGSLYWHFSNKSAILEALLDSFKEELIGFWHGQGENPDVIKQGQEALKSFLSDRRFLETWIELLHHVEARDQMQRLYADLRQLIAKALGERSQLRSTSLVALMEGLLLQATIDPHFDPLPVWRLTAPKLMVQT